MANFIVTFDETVRRVVEVEVEAETSKEAIETAYAGYWTKPARILDETSIEVSKAYAEEI